MTEKIVAILKYSKSNNLSYNSLIKYGRNKLEEFKLPKEFYEVSEVPRSKTGKPLIKDILALLNSPKTKILL